MPRRSEEPARVGQNYELGLDGSKLVEDAYDTREPFIGRVKDSPTRRLLLRKSAENMQRNPTAEEQEAFRRLGITKPEDQIKMYASGLLRNAKTRGIPIDLQGLDEEETAKFILREFPGDKERRESKPPTPKEAPRGKPTNPRRQK